MAYERAPRRRTVVGLLLLLFVAAFASILQVPTWAAAAFVLAAIALAAGVGRLVVKWARESRGRFRRARGTTGRLS